MMESHFELYMTMLRWALGISFVILYFGGKVAEAERHEKAERRRDNGNRNRGRG